PEQASAALPREGARHGRRAVAILDRPPRGGPEEPFAGRSHRYRIAQGYHGCQLIEQPEVLFGGLREPEARVHHDPLPRDAPSLPTPSPAGTGPAPGRVDSPPTSSSSHPSAASRSACATARSSVAKRPPSEKESGVTLTMPMRTG